MSEILKTLGPLRLALLLLALLLVLLMPWVDLSLAPTGWGLLRAAVLPAAAPIVFMVVMLDLLMCQVLKADAELQKRRILNIISVIHAITGVILLLSWLPVFLKATYF